MKTRIILQTLAILALLTGAMFIGKEILSLHPAVTSDGHGDDEAGEPKTQTARGPHGGRIFGDGDFQTEVTIYEPEGLEPNFRLYFFQDGRPLDPAEVRATVELRRINRTDIITFAKEGMLLAGEQAVVEPHSFDAKVVVRRGGREWSWSFQSIEGRVEMAEESRRKAGIVIETAGPGRLTARVELNGRVALNHERTVHITPRFPGMVKSVRKRLGDKVGAGEILATVEGNESLRSYDIATEIAGTVIARHIAPGEYASGQEPVFTVADLSTVLVDFAVHREQVPLVREGGPVRIEGGIGGVAAEAVIEYLAPIASEVSQTVLAHAVIPNPGGGWRPGMFVRGMATVGEFSVPVAVKASALQTFRERDVVFLRIGDLFEAAPVEVGRRDGEWVEIKSGLKAGDQYASENSFVVKADVGKSGATHDH